MFFYLNSSSSGSSIYLFVTHMGLKRTLVWKYILQPIFQLIAASFLLSSLLMWLNPLPASHSILTLPSDLSMVATNSLSSCSMVCSSILHILHLLSSSTYIFDLVFASLLLFSSFLLFLYVFSIRLFSSFVCLPFLFSFSKVPLSGTLKMHIFRCLCRGINDDTFAIFTKE